MASGLCLPGVWMMSGWGLGPPEYGQGCNDVKTNDKSSICVISFDYGIFCHSKVVFSASDSFVEKGIVENRQKHNLAKSGIKFFQNKDRT